MTNIARFMSEVAALMRKRNLTRVQDLLDDPQTLATLQPTPEGMSLLQDLRRFSIKGLESEAQEIEKEYDRSQPAKPKWMTPGTRIDPPRVKDRHKQR